MSDTLIVGTIGISVIVLMLVLFPIPPSHLTNPQYCLNCYTPNYTDPHQQLHSVNVTITGTDYGTLVSPYYILASDGYRYISGSKFYYDASGLQYQEVKLTYIVEGYNANTGCEIRRIKSITPHCVPAVCDTRCVRNCVCGC